MKLAIATDHGGYRYKEKIKAYLAARGHEVCDFGTHSEEPVDYPPLMRAAAQAVARGECELGIVLGGSGNGEAIVANKVRGIRCCVCWCVDAARLAREHNDANMISIGQRLVPESEVLAIVDAWLTARFEGGRHARRVGQIETTG